LRLMNDCRREFEKLGFDIASKVEHCLLDLGNEGIPHLGHLVNQASRERRPYSVSTMRFLRYPDTAVQKGASPHYDRSFFSIHVGDSGGSLMIQTRSGEWQRASPPCGSALVFLGVKAPSLLGLEHRPILHKSTTLRGQERRAAVLFVQADIGHPVPNAQTEYGRLYGSS
jgi:isopenicillin N synthase-like dioxygenase